MTPPDLGTFGGAEPVIPRISGGTGTTEMADAGSLAKRQAYGNVGDLPIGYLDVSARVFNSANLSITASTLTILTFDSERWDTRDLHDTASNTGRLTAPIAGKYHIVVNISWQGSSVGIRLLRLRINGTTFIAAKQEVGFNDTQYMFLSTHYDLALNDYVEVQVNHTSTTDPLAVQADANVSPEFAIVLIP